MIVLEQELQIISPGDTRGSTAGTDPPGAETQKRPPAHLEDRDALRLVRKQYQLAHQYPEDYVVLVGDRVVCHSPDRQKAFRAYDQAFVDFPSGDPVIVEPGGTQKKPPVFRGRSWKGNLGGGR
ncbi:MAG: hypothetical protein GY856_39160 [bacterium]|nr:hypothetical protein [bacterium]